MVVLKKVHGRLAMITLIACLIDTFVSSSALASSIHQADVRPAYKSTPTVATKAVPITCEAQKNILVAYGDLLAERTRDEIVDDRDVDYS
jgi:hypothetical protein